MYNLVLAMLWRHPENVPLDNIKVVHYCAAVSVHEFKPNLLVNEFQLLYEPALTVGIAGVETVEVHWERRQHGQGRHQDAGEKMVGHL